MATSNSDMVIEGFICPECQQDMSSIELLQAHFELLHSKNKSAPFIEQKGFRNKIKTLFTSIDDQDTQTSPNYNTNPSYSTNLVPNSFIKQFLSSNQSEGTVTDHTSSFKKMRDHTIGRYVIQTNKLLITLDKLITFDVSAITDEAKRDAHYKSIVPWIKDVHVNLCPNCAKSFNILYRKHHCRLCGAIMCNQCSQFISYTSAKELTDPESFNDISMNDPESTNQPAELKLRRSDSITSLNSYFFKSTKTHNDHTTRKSMDPKLTSKIQLSQVFIRLCFDCSNLLKKKYKSSRDKMVKPSFVSHYDELMVCLNGAARLHPVYSKMSQSLNLGETTYQLSNAEEMRSKLIKLYQKAESLSGLILKSENSIKEIPNKTKDSNDASNIKNRDQLKLQRNIRMYVVNYLKENSFSLGQLPTKELYLSLKAQREENLREEMNRIEYEQQIQKHQIAEVARRKQMSKWTHNRVEENHQIKKEPTISIDNSVGWVGGQNIDIIENNENSLSHGDDNEQQKALRIQIQLVEGYLDDALKQNKYEEADLLQKNLNELLNMQEKCG